MASEPLFEEQSDAVKVCETPYPTNGSGKNLAEDTRFKCSDPCTHACPYRLAKLGTFPEVGDSKRPRKKEIIVFKIFTHTHLTISYAGFFAKSQIIFFRPSSFRHCPSLKNDGTGEFAFEKQ
ncbi:MAG: hypothetical protein E6293_08185 [Dialister sp.]|nr:hypothetical protein [Dialister sp.]